MAGLVSTYIESFTYAGLFVILALCGLGLPLPEDAALLAGGYLVHRGITRYSLTLVVSFVGVIAGDHSLFFMGRHFGTGLVKKLGIGRPGAQLKIDRINHFMARHGNRTIFYARFLIGLRALIYLTAGSFGVSMRTFFIYDVLGAVISVPIVVSLGFFFGEDLQTAVNYVGGFERLVLTLVVLSVAIYATRILAAARSETTSRAGAHRDSA